LEAMGFLLLWLKSLALIVLKSKPVELSFEGLPTPRLMYQPTNLVSEQTTLVSYGTTYKMGREADPQKGTSQSPAPSSTANKRKRKDDTMAKANSQSNRRAVAAETSQPPSIEKAMDSDGFQDCEPKPQHDPSSNS
jgi:hypothetical protein